MFPKGAIHAAYFGRPTVNTHYESSFPYAVCQMVRAGALEMFLATLWRGPAWMTSRVRDSVIINDQKSSPFMFLPYDYGIHSREQLETEYKKIEAHL